MHAAPVGVHKRRRQHKARLVIAKLDRLARSVALISGLMESGVEFVAADMPEAKSRASAPFSKVVKSASAWAKAGFSSRI